jgi:nicotinate-nucleotide adenylyltransferase
MMQLTVEDMDNVTVSDFANIVQSPQTIDTLDAYRIAHPDTHIIWVMGADSFISLPQWERWTEIMETTSLYILARTEQVAAIHNTEPAEIYAQLECKSADKITTRVGWYLDTQFHAPFSATAVRNALQRGETSPYIADNVAEYILANRLYRI